MKRIMRFFIICFLLIGCIQTGFAQNSWKVRPGEGVGPYSIGMSCKQCEQTLTRVKGADHVFVGRKHNLPFWIYYNEGIQVNYDNKCSAVQFYVDKPGIFTDKGIQVGDAQAKFLEAYGKGYVSHELPTAKSQPKQTLYVYKKSGLGFQVEGGIVKFIVVTLKHS